MTLANTMTSLQSKMLQYPDYRVVLPAAGGGHPLSYNGHGPNRGGEKLNWDNTTLDAPAAPAAPPAPIVIPAPDPVVQKQQGDLMTAQTKLEGQMGNIQAGIALLGGAISKLEKGGGAPSGGAPVVVNAPAWMETAQNVLKTAAESFRDIAKQSGQSAKDFTEKLGETVANAEKLVKSKELRKVKYPVLPFAGSNLAGPATTAALKAGAPLSAAILAGGAPLAGAGLGGGSGLSLGINPAYMGYGAQHLGVGVGGGFGGVGAGIGGGFGGFGGGVGGLGLNGPTGATFGALHPAIGLGGGYTGTHLPFGNGPGLGVGLGRIGGVSLAGNPDGGSTAHASPNDPLGIYGLNHAVPGIAGTIGSNTASGNNHLQVTNAGASGGAGGGGMFNFSLCIVE